MDSRNGIVRKVSNIERKATTVDRLAHELYLCGTRRSFMTIVLSTARTPQP